MLLWKAVEKLAKKRGGVDTAKLPRISGIAGASGVKVVKRKGLSPKVDKTKAVKHETRHWPGFFLISI
jgi:hypothetical protein